MRVTPGFDNRVNRWLLCGLALVSALMILVAILGKSGDSNPGALQALLFPAISFVVAVWGCVATRRSERSFHYLGASMVAFALAMYGFGTPWKLVVLIGLTGIVGPVVLFLLGERCDKRAEEHDR